MFSRQVQELFKVGYGEVYHVQAPSSRERRHFFEDLILNQAAKAPASKKKSSETNCIFFFVKNIVEFDIESKLLTSPKSTPLLGGASYCSSSSATSAGRAGGPETGGTRGRHPQRAPPLLAGCHKPPVPG